jgi:RNA polymerase sigma-70 factor (ECF subfamily)
VNPNEFIPTRQSLLSRLKDWDNQDSWREFFNTYWRLIYEFAVKAGLKDAEAQDVVQETVLSVANQMQGFQAIYPNWIHNQRYHPLGWW